MPIKMPRQIPGDRERRAAAGMTGRYIVTLERASHDRFGAHISSITNVPATVLDHSRGTSITSRLELPSGGTVLFASVGMALVNLGKEHEDAFISMAENDDAILAIEPERVVHAISTDYVRGFCDGVAALADRVAPRQAAAQPAAVGHADTAIWGLSATNVVSSRSSGAGITIAILDTGLDLTHPDFKGRSILTGNFVSDGAPFHDGHGHGTHCTGTACGPLTPERGPRYGIAYKSRILSGRVLDDSAAGGDGNVFAGIDWALANRADIISLSLGAPYQPGDSPYSMAYETAAQRAIAAGCVIVAAAGNEYGDPAYIGALGPPSNSPSAVAVAALDEHLATAPFSCRRVPGAPDVKAPDIAAPGMNVLSAWPVAKGSYQTLAGTSMATPHVAGILALCAEANPGIRGKPLVQLLLAGARRLAQPSGEVGAGFAQAP